jgi:hypothetical protein
MKGTAPSQTSRAPSGLRFTATTCHDGEANLLARRNFTVSHQLSCLLEGEIMTIVTVGIDLAKNVFAVHGVDETGKPVLHPHQVSFGVVQTALTPRELLNGHTRHQADRPRGGLQSVALGPVWKP